MDVPVLSRRRFVAIAGGAAASFLVSEACGLAGEPTSTASGRLTVRPKAGVKTSAKGTQPLGLETGRDAVLLIPASASDKPLPLMVLLHGAGGRGDRGLQRFSAAAETAGVAVLAPDSRGQTWDAIRGEFGPDVTFIDRALERVFATVAVDPARLSVGGFSDGATYALSLGLVNGDLFPRIAAFSPGFIVDGATHGTPRVFISHGIADPVLPIDRCSRLIVPALRTRGHDVTFREFDGGHEVPAAIAVEGFQWAAR